MHKTAHDLHNLHGLATCLINDHVHDPEKKEINHAAEPLEDDSPFKR